MSKPKIWGVLGIKDIRTFNLSLLGKWRWRFLVGNPSLLCGILVAKYVKEVTNTPMLAPLTRLRFASSWWKYISLLSSRSGSNGDWFGDRVSLKMGNGDFTAFCHNTWLGHILLVGYFHDYSFSRTGKKVMFKSWVVGPIYMPKL